MTHSDGKLDQKPDWLELAWKLSGSGMSKARFAEVYADKIDKVPAGSHSAKTYLAALPPAGAGEVVVPREPTPEMFGAGGVAQFKADCAQTPVREAVGAVYRAMIDAAPAIELSGNSGELPVPTNTVGGEADPKRKHGYTVNLTDEEMDALEKLAEEHQLKPWRVLLQGLRLYQLQAHPVDLGPMLPPDLASPDTTSRDSVIEECVKAVELLRHSRPAPVSHDAGVSYNQALVDVASELRALSTRSAQ